MGSPIDARGRRAPTPSALASLAPVADGYRVLPDPLHGQPLLRVPARPAEVRVMLSRSYESAQADEPSQDYLALRYEPRRLTFVVTDGVGSSFLGDVAAQILAINLADWLANDPGGKGTAAALDQYLQRLSVDVADRVATWPIDDSVPALIRAALDQQRGYGSEAMFVAGTVDLIGRRDAAVTIAWLGDARLHVIMRDGRRTDHSGHTNDRWSSRLGPRGVVRSQTWPVADVARVLACTDGVLPVLNAAVDQADATLVEVLRAQASRPGNDDMALIDVGLAPQAMPADDGTNPTLWRRLTEEPQRRHARSTPAGSALRRFIRAVGPPTASGDAERPAESTETLAHPAVGAAAPTPVPVLVPPAAPPPSTKDEPGADPAAGVEPPGPLAWQRVGRGRELNWPSMPGADSYAVQLCREKTFAEPMLYTVSGLTFAVPPMGAPLFGRVRSVAAGLPGPWGPVYDLTERPTETGAL